ncbi:hypothetical protein LEP1GSC193_4219 [Leptospira alstonii serovar Pingchang str. 80-412]|uniref:Uncharacterized protein n=2 Tax=Leptospira alstonii TaxID=28452 RepID=M6CRH5_9LEPT|nr:hypothetical protein LEP1GSC194_1878 [Leptospira alstonii serovar Sichuan str. 79601]EQA78364.1 hypothetical protein LEP1GSC193_4219 [Leptospira alstonii serovar Pingchang str. 80-412]
MATRIFSHSEDRRWKTERFCRKLKFYFDLKTIDKPDFLRMWELLR